MKQSIKLAKTAVVTTALRSFDREMANRYLVRTLSEMTGIGAKLGQVLGMRLGCDASAIPQMPLDEIWEAIREHAPDQVHNIEWIQESGFAASIGQAHMARLIDGRAVCIKIQRPGIADLMQEQLDAALSLINIGPPKKYGVDANAYRFFLRDRIGSELDYRIEAQNQIQIGRDLGAVSSLIIPSIVFSSKNILIQSFEASSSIEAASLWPSIEARSHVGQTLLDAFFRMLLIGGTLHADLHPANIGCRLGSVPRLVIYDYGSVVQLGHTVRSELSKLLTGSTLGKSNESVSTLIDLGFDAEKLSKVRNLNDSIERFLENLLEVGFSPAGQMTFSQQLRSELGPDAWWFRTAGPPWFLYVMRSFFGVIHALNSLKAEVSYRRSIETCLDCELNPQTPATRSDAFNEKLELIAQHLKVSIKENDVEVVNLELPARAVENLEDLLPEHTLSKLDGLGHDIYAIKTEALQQRCPPSVLFEDIVGSRKFRIWLE